MKKSIIIAISFLTISCHQKAEQKREVVSREEINGEENPADIKIPTTLWDLIEEKKAADFAVKKNDHKSEGPNGNEAKKNGDEANQAGSAKMPVVFTPVDVYLREKNKGVLTHEELVFHLPRGGGEIDLAKYVTTVPGSFYVKFSWPEMSEDKDERVVQTWFVSQARKRKIDDEVYGSGCKNFFELTSQINKEMKKDGLKVNTTRNRHLSVLGGHFIFSTMRAGQRLLTQVTFTDSKNQNLFCQGQQVDKQ